MHHKHLDDFDNWYLFAKEMLDFWAPVYYPYYVAQNASGFLYEDTLKTEDYKAGWNKLKSLVNEYDDKDFPLYSAYEWQGSGADGDHNVFYNGNDGEIHMPLEYTELCKKVKGMAIAIPHHTGYKPGHRGKNWDTHNESVSPVMEIYSSHGSSETSDATIPLNVHIHMGPRAEEGTALYALKKGVKVGLMASGDNHVCPAISGNGFMAVISDQLDKNEIFKSIQNRHVYGVTRNKIKLNYTINNSIMGSEIVKEDINNIHVDVEAGAAIDRVEFYRNGLVEDVYVNSGKWERQSLGEIVKFKFEWEFGWGPDRRVFKDIKEKFWDIELNTTGRICSVEKLWTSPGSNIESNDDNTKIKGKILTRKAKQQGGKLSQKNYLTPNIQNQSIIVEIEDNINNFVEFIVDGEKYTISIKELLEKSTLIGKEEEVKELLSATCDFHDYYREDPWWHNAYKFVIHKASPEISYNLKIDKTFRELWTEEDNIFVKVIQKNGDVAWSSPIWVKEGN